LRPHLLSFSLITSLAVCLAGPAEAVVISLWDFDGNDQPGATSASAGAFTLQDASFGVGPYQGNRFGLLETAGGAAPGTVESSLGLGNNTIRQVFNKGVRQPGFTTSKNKDVDAGSAFQINFTALAGDVLEFDWNMLSTETGRTPASLSTFTDFAWYELAGAATDDGALANVNDGTFGPLGPSPYGSHTGQQQTSITLTNAGTYTITVGVNDVADNAYSSALMIDFFRLVRGPEPGTFGTVALGLIGLSWLSRRRPGSLRGDLHGRQKDE
jgi:hypothetical protein